MEIEKTGNSDKSHFFCKLKSYCNIAEEAAKFPALDGLRAIAIILVLLRHSVRYWENELSGKEWNIFYNGWIGVDLFFVLSGFLISYHLLSKWPERQAWNFTKKYFIKRALRILPLYIAIILIVCWGVMPYYISPQSITINSLSIHALFLQDYFYSTIVLPLWSLAVEEKFYLVAPLLVFAAIYLPKKTVFISIIIIIAFQHYLKMYGEGSATYSYYFWNYRAPFHLSTSGILCGFIVAYAYLNYSVSSNFKLWIKYLTICSVIIVIYMLFSERWLESQNWNMATHATLVCSIAFSLMIYNILINPLSLANFLESRFCRFLAKLAYPLYICHITIIPLSIVLVSKLDNMNNIYKFIMFFVVYISIALIFSIILHLIVEKPFLKMKSKLH